MPPRFQLRVHEGPRDRDRFPSDGDALGRSLFGMLTDALEKGLPRPALLCLDADRLRQVDIVPVLRSLDRDRERMLAALGGQPELECAALAGTLALRTGRGQPPRRALVVYLEWPDNRWWTAWQALTEDRALVGDEPVIRRAEDGWPRPGGVGGWFARARREGLTARLERKPEPGHQAGLDLVH
jgi:hypothetical protein